MPCGAMPRLFMTTTICIAISLAQRKVDSVVPEPLPEAVVASSAQFAMADALRLVQQDGKDACLTLAEDGMRAVRKSVEENKELLESYDGSNCDTDFQGADKDQCLCTAKQKLPEIWNAYQATIANNEKLWKKSRQIECAVNKETSCKFNDVPKAANKGLVKEAANAQCDASAKLLSQGKPTKQSSTGWGGKSSLAVDGDHGQVFNSGGWSTATARCTHTQSAKNQWWRVDLGQEYALRNVNIYNRLDCCSDRLDGFEVWVTNTDKFDDVNRQKCAFDKVNNYGTAVRKDLFKVDCVNTRGRYVFVVLPRHNVLTLCEVDVFGRSGAKFTSPLE